MKKFFVPVLALFLFVSMVSAAETTPQNMGMNNETGDIIEGNANRTIKANETLRDMANMRSLVQNTVRARVKNATSIREMLQERKQEMNQESEGLGEQIRSVHRNQNKIRLAVHSFLALENVTGIGRNVSEIARKFNNSVKLTIRAEEKIKNRNWFSRMFMGGDSEAAEEIESEVQSNRERLMELKRLKEVCNCTQEIRGLIQEQIQEMEQEQERLNQLAQNEKQDKGLFGWIFR